MNNIVPFSAERNPTDSDDSEPRGLPPGFSVSAYPILTIHWFGVGAGSAGHASASGPVKSRPNHHGGEARHAGLRQAG